MGGGLSGTGERGMRGGQELELGRRPLVTDLFDSRICLSDSDTQWVALTSLVS